MIVNGNPKPIALSLNNPRSGSAIHNLLSLLSNPGDPVLNPPAKGDGHPHGHLHPPLQRQPLAAPQILDRQARDMLVRACENEFREDFCQRGELEH